MSLIQNIMQCTDPHANLNTLTYSDEAYWHAVVWTALWHLHQIYISGSMTRKKKVNKRFNTAKRNILYSKHKNNYNTTTKTMGT